MKLLKSVCIFLLLSSVYFLNANESGSSKITQKKIIYLVSDIRIPFWQIMSKGIKHHALSLGYDFEIYSSNNIAKKELELTFKAIQENVAGIIVSPTNSSACVTILKLAKQANIPVVISDIGTDGGDYVSYISSDNFDGGYSIGKILSQKMIQKGWKDGRVGIIAVPQKRLNGQKRTAGFMKAMRESDIKGANIKQMVHWTNEESYQFTEDMIRTYPNLRAIWLQSANSYKGVLNAINDAGKKNEILFVSFDAEPEFLDLISQGDILASAVQQPYLMGKEALFSMHNHLLGKKVQKSLELAILGISAENIQKKMATINLNVLGIEE